MTSKNPQTIYLVYLVFQTLIGRAVFQNLQLNGVAEWLVRPTCDVRIASKREGRYMIMKMQKLIQVLTNYTTEWARMRCFVLSPYTVWCTDIGRKVINVHAKKINNSHE